MFMNNLNIWKNHFFSEIEEESLLLSNFLLLLITTNFNFLLDNELYVYV